MAIRACLRALTKQQLVQADFETAGQNQGLIVEALRSLLQ